MTSSKIGTSSISCSTSSSGFDTGCSTGWEGRVCRWGQEGIKQWKRELKNMERGCEAEFQRARAQARERCEDEKGRLASWSFPSEEDASCRVHDFTCL